MSTQSKPTDNEVSIAEYLSTFQREYGAAYNRFELAKENGNDQLASELKDKMFGMEREHIRDLEHRLAEALSGDDNELKLLLTDSLVHYWESKAASSLPTQPILLRLLARGNREPTLEEENLAYALEERYRETQEDTQELAAMYASTRNEVESNRERIKQHDELLKQHSAAFVKIRKRFEQLNILFEKLSDVIVRCGGKRVSPPTELHDELLDKFILEITNECDRLGLRMVEPQEAEDVMNASSLEDETTKRRSLQRVVTKLISSHNHLAQIAEGLLAEFASLKPAYIPQDSLERVAADTLQSLQASAACLEEESDLQDVAEEKTNAKEAFDIVGNGALSIPASDFGKVLEFMGTTYCEEAHRGTINKISTVSRYESGDRIISKESFVDWYVVWIFSDDESDSD